MAQPLAALANTVNYAVTVIDDRPDWAHKERFPAPTQIMNTSYETAAQELKPNKHDAVVIVTRDHAADQRLLEILAPKHCGYLGMIGSKRKILIAFERAAARGLAEQLLQNVFAPVGLDIGAQSPEEIAVSIMAQILKEHRYHSIAPSHA